MISLLGLLTATILIVREALLSDTCRSMSTRTSQEDRQRARSSDGQTVQSSPREQLEVDDSAVQPNGLDYPTGLKLYTSLAGVFMIALAKGLV